MLYIFNENFQETSKKNPYSLMSKEEFDASKQFKTDHIYPKIKQDWCLNDSNLVSKWVDFAEKYRPSAQTISAWEPLLAKAKLTAAEDKELSGYGSIRRVQRNVERFKKEYLQPENNLSDGVSHGKLLPNSIATMLVNRFRVLPGSEVTAVLRALATKFVFDELDTRMTAEDLCNHVEDNGGFDHFVTAVPKHYRII